MTARVESCAVRNEEGDRLLRMICRDSVGHHLAAGALRIVGGAANAGGENAAPRTPSHVDEPNTDIGDWPDHQNDNPRPYVWVNTADQILASLAKYCERISETVH